MINPQFFRWIENVMERLCGVQIKLYKFKGRYKENIMTLKKVI